MSLPCIGDFEATGLSLDSHPVEVAWSLPSGEIRSRLIRPHSEWAEHWDPAAEDLHGISRDSLFMEGVDPALICVEMNRDLTAEWLYFDGGVDDLRWLSQLFQAARMRPTFKVGDFDMLLALAGVVDTSRRDAAEARARVDVGDLQLHRAGNDVKFLQRWYVRARGGMRY